MIRKLLSIQALYQYQRRLLVEPCHVIILQRLHSAHRAAHQGTIHIPESPQFSLRDSLGPPRLLLAVAPLPVSRLREHLYGREISARQTDRHDNHSSSYLGLIVPLEFMTLCHGTVDVLKRASGWSEVSGKYFRQTPTCLLRISGVHVLFSSLHTVASQLIDASATPSALQALTDH